MPSSLTWEHVSKKQKIFIFYCLFANRESGRVTDFGGDLLLGKQGQGGLVTALLETLDLAEEVVTVPLAAPVDEKLAPALLIRIKV